MSAGGTPVLYVCRWLGTYFLKATSRKGKRKEVIDPILSDPVRVNEDRDSANRILMGNFLEHMKQLHNKELLLTSAESQRFTRMLLNRPRENIPPLPFFMQRGTILDSSTNILRH